MRRGPKKSRRTLRRCDVCAMSVARNHFTIYFPRIRIHNGTTCSLGTVQASAPPSIQTSDTFSHKRYRERGWQFLHSVQNERLASTSQHRFEKLSVVRMKCLNECAGKRNGVNVG